MFGRINSIKRQTNSDHVQVAIFEPKCSCGIRNVSQWHGVSTLLEECQRVQKLLSLLLSKARIFVIGLSHVRKNAGDHAVFTTNCCLVELLHFVGSRSDPSEASVDLQMHSRFLAE